MTLFFFNLINIAQAHEEGATRVTVENSLGPILAFVIIFLAIVIGKYIKKSYRGNTRISTQITADNNTSNEQQTN